VLREQPRLDGPGEFDFLSGVKQRGPGNLVQVYADQVALFGDLVCA
jgi:hypothetical protein